MSGACSTHRRWENNTEVLLGNLNGSDHFGDLGLGGRIIL